VTELSGLPLITVIRTSVSVSEPGCGGSGTSCVVSDAEVSGTEELTEELSVVGLGVALQAFNDTSNIGNIRRNKKRAVFEIKKYFIFVLLSHYASSL
jgi:hypothetical protein